MKTENFVSASPKLPEHHFNSPRDMVAVHTPTLLHVPIVDSEGNSVVEFIDVDTVDDALKCLSYSDFEIHRLLASGVQLHPINIQPDYRLGITDAMIDDYNMRLESIVNEMYNDN